MGWVLGVGGKPKSGLGRGGGRAEERVTVLLEYIDL